ncbi:anti-sigma factor [Actinoplanes cyaneus]|uniref:Anti-sigma factor n=1 Tax=Actinoplanes cyaneus TaxID=52696 RepID=A0A919MEU9_9ACTN|nr:zf-HC2 domain-containing protein [Actinoplanes cyaneus]MCW2141837.1 putative zinc-finger [Actinoplanes cyaneus]GID68556.1 anti-sigma factor [Actinoplanes cyaneus]
MRCEDGHDDAAYVLGALSAAERAAYEQHLATCSFCREAVADLSRVPDMLDRLDADEFARLLDPALADRPPERSYPVSPPRSAAPRSKTFPVRVLSTVAAVLLIVMLGGGVTLWLMNRPAAGSGAGGPAVAMTAVEPDSPITATIRVVGTPGGTKVEMVCAYAASGKPYTFRLIAYGPDDQSEQLGSWTPQPGAEFPMQGATHFAAESLDRLDLVRFDGKVMLTYRPR